MNHGEHTPAYGPHVRHPQYVGFIAIMLGFLVMWPTLLALLMFPVLTLTYVRLALREERESAEAFGDAWHRYASRTPQWLPRLVARRPQTPAGGLP